ncbi:MAG TPA: hypothetical protein VLI93_15335 [Acetobacteraceae bacterium]|nr:hypothetical protein [Acetobacteraceae bacterium]
MTALSRGGTPGPENSIAKVVNASKLQSIAAFGVDLLGMAGAVMEPELVLMQALFQDAALSSSGHRIAGGCRVTCAWTRTCRLARCGIRGDDNSGFVPTGDNIDPLSSFPSKGPLSSLS